MSLPEVGNAYGGDATYTSMLWLVECFGCRSRRPNCPLSTMRSNSTSG